MVNLYLLNKIYPNWQKEPTVRTMNKAEQRACKKLWTRIDYGRPRYRDFRKLVYYNNMMGCWMVLWHGMWIGIEKDGYTHS